jgi:predicted membrane GTPase involved in stress response
LLQGEQYCKRVVSIKIAIGLRSELLTDTRGTAILNTLFNG